MARLVRINDERNRAEREAQERLAHVLPAEWIVTTNIKEFNFQRNRRELDSLLICPLGVFVLDFKNHGGHVTPQTNQPWGGVQEQKNPFSQGQDSIYAPKDKLESAHPGEKWWVEWLVVMTNPRVVLDWTDSDCDDALRSRVCLVDEVQDHVERIAGKSRFRLEFPASTNGLGGVQATRPYFSHSVRRRQLARTRFSYGGSSGAPPTRACPVPAAAYAVPAACARPTSSAGSAGGTEVQRFCMPWE